MLVGILVIFKLYNFSVNLFINLVAFIEILLFKHQHYICHLPPNSLDISAFGIENSIATCHLCLKFNVLKGSFKSYLSDAVLSCLILLWYICLFFLDFQNLLMRVTRGESLG